MNVNIIFPDFCRGSSIPTMARWWRKFGARGRRGGGWGGDEDEADEDGEGGGKEMRMGTVGMMWRRRRRRQMGNAPAKGSENEGSRK